MCDGRHRALGIPKQPCYNGAPISDNEAFVLAQPSPRISLILLVLILLATGLAFSMPGDRVARALFDSPATPTPTDTPLVTDTPVPTETPAPSATPTTSPTPEITPENDVATPSSDAGIPTVTPEGIESGETPAAIEPASAAPANPGFLPAPTLTSPDAAGIGSFPSLSPNLAPPLTGPAASLPEPAQKLETAPGEAPSAAQLIDNGLVALSYVWLCCGVFFLIGATLGVVWLVRRSRRRSRDAGTPRT